MENDEKKRITNIFININLTYWSVLITVNGIIISIFSLVSILKDIGLFFILSIPSIIACLLIINNFQITQYQYKIIMDRLINPITDQAEKSNDIQQAKNVHKIINENINKVLRLMFVQIVIIVIIAILIIYNWFVK